jgi:hypothetical protein
MSHGVTNSSLLVLAEFGKVNAAGTQQVLEAWRWRQDHPAATVPRVSERYGMVLLPSTSHDPDASNSTDELVAQRQRDGWQLVSSRVDQ